MPGDNQNIVFVSENFFFIIQQENKSLREKKYHRKDFLFPTLKNLIFQDNLVDLESIFQKYLTNP